MSSSTIMFTPVLFSIKLSCKEGTSWHLVCVASLDYIFQFLLNRARAKINKFSCIGGIYTAILETAPFGPTYLHTSPF